MLSTNQSANTNCPGSVVWLYKGIKSHFGSIKKLTPLGSHNVKRARQVGRMKNADPDLLGELRSKNGKQYVV